MMTSFRRQPGLFFKFDILIEGYLQGPLLSLEQIDLSKVSELLAKLHALNPTGMSFVTWQDPLAAIYELARDDLAEYMAKKSRNNKTINLARELLVSLHWILWGATKLCDLNEYRTAPELIEAHAAKISSHERIADPANIEKLLDSFHLG